MTMSGQADRSLQVQFEACAPQIDSRDRQVRPTKLFVGGITRHTTTKQLRDHFLRYGRVLDCVAMRQPDGRSRGFGYVTLDSPESADHAMSEPQVIDGRTVDMKRAVPEGSGSSPASGAVSAKGSQDMSCAGPMRIGQPGYWPWVEAQYPYFGTSPMGARPVNFPESNPFATHAPLLGQQASSPLAFAGSKSPKAVSETPDCLHLRSRGAREAAATAATLSATAIEFVPTANGRRPLGELPDITNILNNQELSKPKYVVSQNEKLKDVSADKVVTKEATGLYAKPAPVGRVSKMTMEIREDSDQENGSKSTESSSEDSDTDPEKITAHSVLPGLPPIRATALPAPLQLPGLAAASCQLLPPGLSPVEPSGVASWQPDDELSPTSVSSPVGMMPVLASSPHGMGTIFSTVPYANSVPHSLAGSPTNSTAPSVMLQDTSSAPQPVRSLVPKPSVAEAVAAPLTAPVTEEDEAVAISGKTSIGTQTDGAYEVPCSICGDTSTAKMGCSETVWIRDDLLRLRSAMGKDSRDVRKDRLQAKEVAAA